MNPVPRVVADRPLWDMLGTKLPRGVLGLSDPDIHLIQGRWTMFLGGFSTTFRNRLYQALLPGGDAPRPDGRHLDLRPLTPDPPRRAWDAGGMHTPSYVPAHRGRPPLLYYAGRATTRHYGPGSCYAIGVLAPEQDGSWRRREAPVLRGWSGRPSVLEPKVIRVDEGYRMWFLATPHEVGTGEQPDFTLHVADSTDGLRWQDPRPFTTAAEGFFDSTLHRVDDGWEMLLARGTNLHGTDPYPAQGLWGMQAGSPLPDRADWTAPRRLLDASAPGTPSWRGRGVCGPSVVVLSRGRRRVFVTGTHDVGSWGQAARHRLARAGLLPAPAPYFLATGFLDIDV